METDCLLPFVWHLLDPSDEAVLVELLAIDMVDKLAKAELISIMLEGTPHP